MVVIYTIILLLMFGCEIFCLPRHMQDSTLTQKSSSASRDDSDVISDVIRALDDVSATPTKYNRVDDAIMLLLTGEVRDSSTSKLPSADGKQEDKLNQQHDEGDMSNSADNFGEKEILESFFASTRGRLIPENIHNNSPGQIISTRGDQQAAEPDHSDHKISARHLDSARLGDSNQMSDTTFSQNPVREEFGTHEHEVSGNLLQQFLTEQLLDMTPSEYQRLEMRHDRQKQIISTLCQSLGQADCDKLIKLLRRISGVPLSETVTKESERRKINEDNIRSKNKISSWMTLAERNDHDAGIGTNANDLRDTIAEIESKDMYDLATTKRTDLDRKSQKEDLIERETNVEDLAEQLHSALARFSLLINNHEQVRNEGNMASNKQKNEQKSENGKQNLRQKRSIQSMVSGHDRTNQDNGNNIIVYKGESNLKEKRDTINLNEDAGPTHYSSENLVHNFYGNPDKKQDIVPYASQVGGRFDQFGIKRQERKRTRRAVSAHQNSVLPLRLPDNMTPEMRETIATYMAWKQANGYGMKNARWG